MVTSDGCIATRTQVIIDRFFSTLRYWSGLILLCVRTNLRKEALNLVVSLGDLKLIKDSQPWGMYRRSNVILRAGSRVEPGSLAGGKDVLQDTPIHISTLYCA